LWRLKYDLRIEAIEGRKDKEKRKGKEIETGRR
jgi:hypothetical protein